MAGPGRLTWGILRLCRGSPVHRSHHADEGARRTRLLVAALWLSSFSVAWGTLSGGVSVTIGVLDGSLGVLGLGLNVLADVTGSAVLIWRFRAELRHTGHADMVEARATAVVAAALGTVSIVLAVAAIDALAVGSRPESSVPGLVTAGLAFVVLSPLAYAKRRVGAELGSRALRGDGTLSGIGAAVALLALTGIALDRSFGWWWADRVAALIVAGIAAVEAVRLVRGRPMPG
jgi:divalent metal cation (Fe/Co/Zn/Cd) transporter